ncbi:Telo-bind domain-containing protein [Favolaschia claudopus]|uniref:Telo-bind domain-containing protein n=1 Tax=Favolaschia claudopus TaxID=2862362 RepID=A0AAW0CI99_9AGAR
MKRVADDVERASKRIKLDRASIDSSIIFADPAQEKTAADLLKWSAGLTGYIAGKICMKWPAMRSKYRIKMDIWSLADGQKQFEVVFDGAYTEEFRRRKLVFGIGQEIKLSLEGAVAEKASASQSVHLPISLRYTQGVALEIVPQSDGPAMKVDTWYKPSSATEVFAPVSADTDWFSTPIRIKPRAPASKTVLMDIDEEPVADTVHPSVAPKSATPLNNIRNLSSKTSPSSHSTHKPLPVSTSRSVPITTIPSIVGESTAPTEVFRNQRPLATTSKLVAPPPRIPPSTSTPPNRAPVPNAAVVLANPSVPECPAETVSLSDNEPITHPEKVLNKKQRKNQARKEKRKQQKAGSALPSVAPPDDPPEADHVPASADPVPPDAAQAPPPPLSPQIPSPVSEAKQLTPPPPPIPPHASASNPQSPPSPPRLQVPYRFTALSNFHASRSYSVIAIVTSITDITKSRTGQWTCSLRVVDQSNCDESYGSSKEGLLVNCFREVHKEWLPSVSVGDVIFLSEIKPSKSFGGAAATGYSDKFKWAVYDSAKGDVKHGNGSNALGSQFLGEGFGVQFSPFYHPSTTEELTYCAALRDWWKGVEAKRLAAKGTIHQIPADPTITYRSSSHRKHQLFSEIAESGQYFDCTVRVLHGHPNGQTYRLYVTDGTPLQGSKPCPINTCSPSLVDRVVAIEMWDNACAIGPQMLPDECYLLRNVRLIQSKEGYAECKLVETKIQKLELNAADEYPSLKALLERLRPYDEEQIEEPEVKLISSVQDREFFNCVVELLHKDATQQAIYVTDYTSHPKVPTANEPWALGLGNRVLKIALFDHQPAMAERLTVGRLYMIKNLRLQQSQVALEFRGTLGGSENLIIPINPKLSSYETWKHDLLSRKNEVKISARQAVEGIAVSIPPTAQAAQPQDHSTYEQDLKLAERPGGHRFIGRILDFYPFQLKDSFERMCTRCNELIPQKRLACFRCNDVKKEYVKVVCVLRLEFDLGGQIIYLSVSGNVPLLEGFEPTILRDNPEATRRFADIMQPLLHNLEAVHDGILNKQVIEPSSPEMTLIVDTWKGTDQKIVYGLRGIIS